LEVLAQWQQQMHAGQASPRAEISLVGAFSCTTFGP
jgi:hypothetical protein